MNLYTQIPKTITYKDLLGRRHSLAPSNYRSISTKNKNLKKLRDLILGKPQKGREVGSSSYVNKSNFYFIRNRALQTYCFLPTLNNTVCAVPILPMVFKDFKLRKGDILLAKDANIGDTAYLNEDLSNFMISSGIVKLRFPEEVRYYIFAFMKNNFFRNQIDSMISKGATIRHAKTLWLDAVIPFPNQKNKEEVINFISTLTKAVIRKEKEIKEKYKKIMKLIDKELKDNQKSNRFIYSLPTLRELLETRRLNASIYSLDFKHKIFYIENYKMGSNTIGELGFQPKRGPNLAVSVIGRSIYTEEEKPHFYKLIEPMDITDFMTIRKFRWIGNKTKIPHLRKGDILFGAEGNIGKVYIFCEEPNNTITNYHGMTINTAKIDLIENIFLGCFLSFVKEQGILDKIAVGGQGGSVGKKRLLSFKIPNFPRNKKEEIAKYYFNTVNCNERKLNLADFENEDMKLTSELGIWQLDKQIKQIKQKLNEILHKIVRNEGGQIPLHL